MIDLVGLIVSRFTSSSDADVVTLRSLLTGGIVAVFSHNKSRPYCVADEIQFTSEYVPMGESSRVDERMIQFSIYADTRDSAGDNLEALQNAYLGVTIAGTLAAPQILDRLVFREPDCWRAVLTLRYLVQS